MTISTRKILMAKARGMVHIVELMGEKERASRPRGNVGEDYNVLRNAVVENFCELSPFLPPKLEIYEGATEGKWTQCDNSALGAFCEQIYQMLAVEEE